MRIEGDIDLDVWGLGAAFGFDEDGSFFLAFQILPVLIHIYLYTAPGDEAGV